MDDNTAPAAVEGASVRLSTLVDGTLRVVIEVEPVNAVQAFRLFGKPGTPVVIAAMRTES